MPEKAEVKGLSLVKRWMLIYGRQAKYTDVQEAEKRKPRSLRAETIAAFRGTHITAHSNRPRAVSQGKRGGV